jgi:hypothetical protein
MYLYMWLVVMVFSTITRSLRYQSTKAKGEVSLGKRARGGVGERNVEEERCILVRVDKIQMSERRASCIIIERSVVVGNIDQ